MEHADDEIVHPAFRSQALGVLEDRRFESAVPITSEVLRSNRSRGLVVCADRNDLETAG